eukprot:1688757-Pleurochrysis_carterae.AAC.6
MARLCLRRAELAFRGGGSGRLGKCESAGEGVEGDTQSGVREAVPGTGAGELEGGIKEWGVRRKTRLAKSKQRTVIETASVCQSASAWPCNATHMMSPLPVLVPPESRLPTGAPAPADSPAPSPRR